MPIDRLLVKQRLALISEYMVELKALAKLSREEFMDKRTAASVESFLRRSLEAIFDIGRHILAKSGGVNMAHEYKSIAQGLEKYAIISSKLKEQLIKMAGYRNRMVHLYYQISDEELYEIISDNLDDIEKFQEEILAYLKQNRE
ncbi:type VII toxin-antitoxin system HepT family RNase toxin [Desulfitibacter alkalitolerans]|uniref:type VII toxin-antitoxin system HepT family RNase toxin n=1 Tax=Desulfitibacter alkalitolerans TaxID=264641 RepID=UPI0004892361|nr:DUF86 domain-containing protein [Desulfitibacter alkalitolerans]